MLQLCSCNEESGTTVQGALNLCNLAGPERFDSSGRLEHKGDEGHNKSLSCLGDVFASLANGALSQLEANVPSRIASAGIDVHQFKSDAQEQQQDILLSLICPASKSGRTWEGFVWYRVCRSIFDIFENRFSFFHCIAFPFAI
jgi:hypothetical protein